MGGGYCAQHFRSVFLFRLGSCGVFNEEVALLAEGQLVKLCKCTFLWYEEYCMYQGTCPDCLGLLVFLVFFSSPYICSVLHSTRNTGTSYEVLNTFIWGREDPLPVYLNTVPLPEVPGKGWLFVPCFAPVLTIFCKEALWPDPSGIVHECCFIWRVHE